MHCHLDYFEQLGNLKIGGWTILETARGPAKRNRFAHISYESKFEPAFFQEHVIHIANIAVRIPPACRYMIKTSLT